MKKVLLSAFATLTLSTVSFAAAAADLPAPYQPPPAPVIARIYNWTGFYVGVNGGYAWGHQDPFGIFTSRFDPLSVSFDGGIVGGTLGAQIQSSHVVMGVEADIDWAEIRGSAVVVPTIAGAIPALCIPCQVSLTTKIDSVTTGRLRVGYAQDNWLLYATAGLAILDANTTVTTVNGFACNSAILGSLCAGTNTRLGATAGAGVEYGLTPELSAKFEYLYIAAASLELSHISELRAGLNYRFGGN